MKSRENKTQYQQKKTSANNDLMEGNKLFKNEI